MRERPASRKLAPIAALTAALWLAGCATTDAENDGQPGIAATVGTIIGQVIGGVIVGMAGALGGQPQDDAYAYSSPTYSTSAYTQTYARPVYRPTPQRQSHHHHGHHRH
jgi:hypothetical protein